MITKPKRKLQPIGVARYPSARDREQVAAIRQRAEDEERERQRAAQEILDRTRSPERTTKS